MAKQALDPNPEGSTGWWAKQADSDQRTNRGQPTRPPKAAEGAGATVRGGGFPDLSPDASKTLDRVLEALHTMPELAAVAKVIQDARGGPKKEGPEPMERRLHSCTSRLVDRRTKLAEARDVHAYHAKALQACAEHVRGLEGAVEELEEEFAELSQEMRLAMPEQARGYGEEGEGWGTVWYEGYAASDQGMDVDGGQEHQDWDVPEQYPQWTPEEWADWNQPRGQGVTQETPVAGPGVEGEAQSPEVKSEALACTPPAAAGTAHVTPMLARAQSAARTPPAETTAVTKDRSRSPAIRDANL